MLGEYTYTYIRSIKHAYNSTAPTIFTTLRSLLIVLMVMLIMANDDEDHRRPWDTTTTTMKTVKNAVV